MVPILGSIVVHKTHPLARRGIEGAARVMQRYGVVPPLDRIEDIGWAYQYVVTPPHWLVGYFTETLEPHLVFKHWARDFHPDARPEITVEDVRKARAELAALAAAKKTSKKRSSK